MNQLPIIFIREYHPEAGHFDGLKYAIESAKKYNPNSRVILIGDKHQPQDLCEFHPIEEYSQNKNALRGIYKHRHKSAKWFIFCNIMAWTVLYEFCAVHDLFSICTLDTDVLTFADLTKAAAPFDTCGYTVSRPKDEPQAPIYIFNTEIALSGYTKFLFDLYNGTAPRAAEILRSNQCCMTLWEWYRILCNPQPRVGDTSRVINGTTFDHNLCMDYDGFEHDGQTKVVKFKKGLPYIHNRDLNQDVQFNILHCWGMHKNRMDILWRQSLESL